MRDCISLRSYVTTCYTDWKNALAPARDPLRDIDESSPREVVCYCLSHEISTNLPLRSRINYLPKDIDWYGGRTKIRCVFGWFSRFEIFLIFVRLSTFNYNGIHRVYLTRHEPLRFTEYLWIEHLTHITRVSPSSLLSFTLREEPERGRSASCRTIAGGKFIRARLALLSSLPHSRRYAPRGWSSASDSGGKSVALPCGSSLSTAWNSIPSDSTPTSDAVITVAFVPRISHGLRTASFAEDRGLGTGTEVERVSMGCLGIIIPIDVVRRGRAIQRLPERSQMFFRWKYNGIWSLYFFHIKIANSYLISQGSRNETKMRRIQWHHVTNTRRRWNHNSGR